MRMKLIAAAVAAVLGGLASQAHAGSCEVDEDCPGFPDEFCDANVCQSKGGGGGGECKLDKDCPGFPDETCDIDGFCQLDPGGGGECKLDEDCPGFPDETCDFEGFCKGGGIGGECKLDKDCPGFPDEVCDIDGFCQADIGGGECLIDDDCAGFPDEYCDIDGFCQGKALLGECELDQDCGVGEYCDFDGLCEIADFNNDECIIDEDCLGFPDEFCYDGLCYGVGEDIIIDKGTVDCEDDFDCPGDSICDVDFFCSAGTILVDDGIFADYGSGPVVTGEVAAGCTVASGRGTPQPGTALLWLGALGLLAMLSRRRRRTR